MKRKSIILRDRATLDIDKIIDYYRTETTEQVALGFIDTLEQGFSHIECYPDTGSSFYALELNLPGLLSWPLKRYPYMVFYINSHDHIDVWRILHSHRDIPHWLKNPE
ncbi:MAG: toxin ParE1/3/4 [Phenylobacterium sp.]